MTEIGTTPAEPAGVTALRSVGEKTCRLVQFTAPIFTAVVPARLVPLIVISVPPKIEPCSGVTDVITPGQTPQALKTNAISTPLTRPSPLMSPEQVPCPCTEEVETPKVIVTAATIESRMFGDFISGLLKLNNRKTWNAFKITPRSGKSKRISAFQDYVTCEIPHKAFPTILGTFNNARGWIRTNDPRFRRPMLYPAELRMQGEGGYSNHPPRAPLRSIALSDQRSRQSHRRHRRLPRVPTRFRTGRARHCCCNRAPIPH